MSQDHRSLTKHPLGLPFSSTTQVCGECFWAKERGPGPKVLRCSAAGFQRVSADWRACQNFEVEPDCLDCGACCGPAYDAVDVSPRDPVIQKHPDLIRRKNGVLGLHRTPENYCVALMSDNKCRIYPDRPKCCRGFEKASDNCAFARRRSGLTPHWGVF